MVLSAFALCLSLSAATPAATAATTYGKGVTMKDSIKLSTLMESPDKYVGKTVRVEGTVTAVCEHAGCWMRLGGDKPGQDIRIKVKDGEIVFPVSAKGKAAVAEGVFAKIDAKESPEAHAKHAEEHKSCETTATYQINGTGALIK